jgi:hypothetical protein
MDIAVMVKGLCREFKYITKIGNIKTNTDKKCITFTINYKGQQDSFFIPVPFIENGVELVEMNNIKRPICRYFNDNKWYSYYEAIFNLLAKKPGLIKVELIGKAPLFCNIKFLPHDLNKAVSIIQKGINSLINKLPLHVTNMNSFIMNHRISIIDKEFNSLSPDEKLKYQVNKNFNKFGRMSSLGLSDGSMAKDNYMLSYDLRLLTPFGINFHNPQRNLYSSLGMLGDEKPLLNTISSKELEEKGIFRTGWNLFTIFVDIPDVWEDQILIDNRHKNKFIEYTKTINCFGVPAVFKGTELKYGDILCADTQERFKVPCDSAIVTSISKKKTIINRVEVVTTKIDITYKRYLYNGTKITNTSANKGVIYFKDLGYAIDPRTGKKRQIDIIVSAKAVLKRKNYSQILEALYNTINYDKESIIDDFASTTEENMLNSLQQQGFPSDGTWECYTYEGVFKCVCGSVFWGVTHDAHDTVWEDGKTQNTNNAELRTSGLKFSSIELRSLITMFGKTNAITNEVMSHSQGSKHIKEMLKVINSQHNDIDNSIRVIKSYNIKPIFSDNGSMYNEEQLIGSITDMYINGCYLQLPFDYVTVENAFKKTLYIGNPSKAHEFMEGEIICSSNKIYIPSIELRNCWRHTTGLYGLNDISSILNTIIISLQELSLMPTEDKLNKVYKLISRYLLLAAKSLSGKKGYLNKLGMSVRYPSSIKAVATLTNDLEPNTVRIHSSMANYLKVKEGDSVIVERFPCFGFMSVRVQKITITNEDISKYTISVQGNSLGSSGLDFDGDVIYIASFHTAAAKLLLHSYLRSPNKYCNKFILNYNSKMGTPRTKSLNLHEYSIKPFDSLTKDIHANIITKLIGVKLHTGPTVSFAYNLLRIAEKAHLSQEINAEIEVLVDIVANSIFKQKHGGESLYKVVTRAICTADVEELIKHGIPNKAAYTMCGLIVELASKIGITNLSKCHWEHENKNKPTIVSKIIRANNIIYYISRAIVSSSVIRDSLATVPVDIPSKLLTQTINTVNTDKEKDCIGALCTYIENKLT